MNDTRFDGRWLFVICVGIAFGVLCWPTDPIVMIGGAAAASVGAYLLWDAVAKSCRAAEPVDMPPPRGVGWAGTRTGLHGPVADSSASGRAGTEGDLEATPLTRPDWGDS